METKTEIQERINHINRVWRKIIKSKPGTEATEQEYHEWDKRQFGLWYAMEELKEVLK